MVSRCIAFAACLLLSPAALGQTPFEPPRTRDGRPDFHGVWASLSIAMVERPTGMALSPGEAEAHALVEKFWNEAPELDDPDIAFYNVRNFSTVNGAIRTSHLVTPADGRLPYTPAGLAHAENEPISGRTDLYDHPEQRPTYERCLAGLAQAPMRTIPLLIPMQIVQTPGALVFWMEDVAGLRTIHMGQQPPPEHMRSHEGWSSGRWDKDTLVIETTHLRPGDHWRTDYGRPVVVDETSRIIEKLTLISQDELLYQFTVEDPELYAQPWLAEFSFRRQDTTVYEYACHEANYSMTNILQGGRVADAKATKK